MRISLPITRPVPSALRQSAAAVMVLLVTLSASRAGTVPESEGILREWIRMQSGIRTLHAEIIQTRRLPTIRIPLKKSGQVWFGTKSRFRWQIGDPPEMLAIKTVDALFLIEPRKSRARILSGDAAPGAPLRLSEIAFPFATSFEEFQRRFEILSFQAEDDSVEVVLRPIDPRMSAGVRSLRVVFQRGSGNVDLFEITLTDNSQIATEFTSVEINPHLQDTLFSHDLTGYRIDDRSGAATPAQ